jgi:hypothetical protein
LLGKGLAGNVSAVAAEKAPFPDEKGRLDGKPPEERRWQEMPLTSLLKEGVEGKGVGAGGEHRTNWGLSKNDNQHRVKTLLEKIRKLTEIKGKHEHSPESSSRIRKNERRKKKMDIRKCLPKKEMEHYRRRRDRGQIGHRQPRGRR